MIVVYEDDSGNTKKSHAREGFERHLKLQGLELETEDKKVIRAVRMGKCVICKLAELPRWKYVFPQDPCP